MRHAIRTVLASVIVLAAAGAAPASEDLRNGIGSLAEKVLSVLKDEPKAVKVGKFSAKTGIPPHVTSEEGIQQMLIQELNVRQKDVVQEGAKLEVNGDLYFVALARGSELKVIKVEAQVVDVETGTSIRIPLDPVVIDANKGLSEVLQHNGPRPHVEDPAKERLEQNKAIQNNVKKPTVSVDGTRISSRQGQPFAIEILKQPLAEFGKKPPQPAPVGKKDGLATAAINRDEIYEVRIFNNSGREVAVAVSIDGIDMFHFSRDRIVGEKDKERVVHLKENEALVGRPRFSHFILTDGPGKPQQELTIPGWHFSQEGDDNFRSFLVTAYGKGAHSKAGIASRAGLGTIQVRFLECYPLDENTRPKDGDETGFGPSRKVATRIVRYGVGAELDSIAVRYTNPLEGK
jgi:hypothetical protein